MSKIAMTMLVGASVGCGSRNVPCSGRDEAFDSARWQHAEATDRCVFVEDLLKNRRLIGKTRADVVRLLGDAGRSPMDDDRLAYVVATGGYGFDKVFVLHIEFSPATQRADELWIQGD
jgi:hypothetical protein